MGERVSRSQTRKFSERIYTTPEEKDKLRDYAMKNSISMNAIVTHFIAMGVEYDIYDPDWIDKLQKFKEKVNSFSRLDDACKALAWSGEKEKWRCVWGREGKPPQVREIGRDMDDLNQFCEACVETRLIMAKILGYEEELTHLRAKVAATTIEIPFCKKGGELHTDGKNLYCTESPSRGGGKYVSISDYCMKKNKGYACDYLKRKPINVGHESQEDNR